MELKIHARDRGCTAAHGYRGNPTRGMSAWQGRRGTRCRGRVYVRTRTALARTTTWMVVRGGHAPTR